MFGHFMTISQDFLEKTFMSRTVQKNCNYKLVCFVFEMIYEAFAILCFVSEKFDYC